MKTSMRTFIRLMLPLAAIVSPCPFQHLLANDYYWDAGANYENLFYPQDKETSNWRNENRSTARTAVAPGESDTIRDFAAGTNVIEVTADVRSNLRFGKTASTSSARVVFDMNGHTWTCPTVFWLSGQNTDVGTTFTTDIMMTNGNLTLEKAYATTINGFALCGDGGLAATSGANRFTFAGQSSRMSLPGDLYINASAVDACPSRVVIDDGARLDFSGQLKLWAAYGAQFHVMNGACVHGQGNLYVHGSGSEFLVGKDATVTLPALTFYQYGNGKSGADARPLTNNVFIVDGGTLNLTNETVESTVSRGNDNKTDISVAIPSGDRFTVKNGGVVNVSNNLWTCWGVLGAETDISGGSVVRAVSMGSKGLGTGGTISVSNATLQLSGALYIGSGQTTASTNYGTNHMLRVAGRHALVTANELCAKFSSTLRFEIGQDGFSDGEGTVRAPVQIVSGWLTGDKYSADKGGQKLDRIVVSAKAFDSRHPTESIVLMTFGTANDQQVKAWADAALANAVIETSPGRTPGTLSMNADYTALTYTAPRRSGLIMLLR